jgi:hypothetical protein
MLISVSLVTHVSTTKGRVIPVTVPANVPATASQVTAPNVQGPTQAAGPWKPAFLQTLKPLEALANVPSPSNMKTFSRDFINATFHGAENSPGLYYIPQSVVNPLLPDRTFYLIDSTFEPYLPNAPGEHGAKLTAFFNNNPPEDNGSVSNENVPLFVSASKWGGERVNKPKASEYVYFGTYSQTRWSDKLDADRVQDSVPLNVKQYWAARLADPGRPSWVTDALMKHFFPVPEYEGAFPKSAPCVAEDGKSSDVDKKMEEDVKEYILELKMWKNFAKTEVGLLTKEKVLEAFDLVCFHFVPSIMFSDQSNRPMPTELQASASGGST